MEEVVRMGQVTLHKLKSHLRSCADILRGSTEDRTNWKTYIREYY